MKFICNTNARREASYDQDVATVVNAASASSARHFLSHRLGRLESPLRRSSKLASDLGLGSLWIKDERHRLKLSSFKALGGQYAVLRRAEQLRRTARGNSAVVFVTATDGNHGISVAAGARSVGCRACIFVPDHVQPPYLATMQAFGAEIIRVEGDYDHAVDAAATAAGQNGWTLVADTTDKKFDPVTYDVMAGYGILLEECLEQLPAASDGPGDPLSHVFVQGGVGGLAAAVAGGLWERLGRHRPRIIIVEPATADCLFQTVRAGEITEASGNLVTNMSMLSCGRPSRMAWAVLKTAGDYFMTISDSCAQMGVKSFNDTLDTGCVPTTPSGAAGLAGLITAVSDRSICKELELDTRSSVLVICTESTPDPAAADLFDTEAVAEAK